MRFERLEVQLSYHMKARTMESRRKSSLTFSEPVQPDVALSAVIGANPLPRSELVKKMWDYIRRHGLQDRRRKMFINADEKLQAVLGKSRVNVLELMNSIWRHTVPCSV
jgi:upstream activation factor subunit UAF30